MIVSENISLDHYIEVQQEGDPSPSFGGSQTWFPVNRGRDLRNLHMSGCGLIASADFFMYFARKNRLFVKAMPKTFISAPDKPVPESEYLEMIRQLSRLSFPVFPGIGAFSFEITRFLNHYFRKMGRKERIRCLFFNTRKKRDELIRKQLNNGYPVPLIIGQHFFMPFSKKGITFYTLEKGSLKPSAHNVYRHFVNITGTYLPDDVRLPLYYEISSWGKKFYIEEEELNRYITRISAPWLSSVFILKDPEEKKERLSLKNKIMKKDR